MPLEPDPAWVVWKEPLSNMQHTEGDASIAYAALPKHWYTHEQLQSTGACYIPPCPMTKPNVDAANLAASMPGRACM